MKFFRCLFVFTCLSFLFVKSQPTLEINSGEKSYIGKNIGYFTDTSGMLSIQQAMKKKFTPGQDDILNFGNQTYTVWMRFNVHSKTEGELYMEIMDPLMDVVEVYQIAGGKPVKLFSGGFKIPFAKRLIKIEDWLIILHSDKKDTASYYIKAYSGYPQQLPIMIYSTAKFVESNQTHNLFWGIYIGIMLFAFIYNLFIYLSVREKAYLYYILYIFFSVCFYMGLQGYGFQLLWPNFPALNPLMPIIDCITDIIITLFAFTFLHITKKQKVLYYWGWGWIIAYILVIIYNLVGNYQNAVVIAQLMSLVYCIYLIYAGINSLRRGVRTAKYFLLAWTLFVILIIVYLLTLNNVIPSNFFTSNCIFIGHMTEVLLLTLALADRIKWLQSENEKSHREIIHQLRENELIQAKANLELEEKVKERTIEVIEQKNEAERQTKISDELLLNILPEEVAAELKATGKCHAKMINQVSVMFADIKDFSLLSERITPQELVFELNECFSEFDRIIEKYGLEKIKTIGDAYMAAGGVPLADHNNAERMIEAAFEIQKFVSELSASKGHDQDRAIQLRIGIHTGSVVAGIVGIKKFSYDIWGGTVNIASRMESSGEAGKVNISESTYNLIKDKYNCTYRGKISAKNKGIIDMFYVEGKI